MCKNKIQFQQGLSLQSFLSQFGSEDQCRNALVHWRWPQGFVCPSCGHTKYCLLKSRDLFQCNRCRAQISITAGTIFDSTKLSLTTWFLSIYFITQSKVSVSALSLKRTIGVSYNTALLIKHKIQAAIQRAAEIAYKTLGSVMDSSFDSQIEDLEKSGARFRILEPRELEQWKTCHHVPGSSGRLGEGTGR